MVGLAVKMSGTGRESLPPAGPYTLRLPGAMSMSDQSTTAHTGRQPIKCAVCEAEFIPRGASVKYCSRPCRLRGHTVRARARHKADPTKNRDYQTAYRKRNNAAVLKHRLKHWYGITVEEYNAMFAAQQGRCAICDEILQGGKKTHLDHDHDGAGCKVRGILCKTCNSGLGYFKDSAALLLKAAEYLCRHKCNLGIGNFNDDPARLEAAVAYLRRHQSA
jgi:hypothetical protein